MKIGNNILFWQGIYAGSGVVFGKKDSIIIDTQMRKDQANLILELMKLYGLYPKNVRYIIDTHMDLDHTGGNAWLKKATGAKIVAHTDDARVAENPEKAAASQARFAAARNEPFEPCKVEVEIKEDTVLEVGDLTLDIIHTPGHTSGSICVYHKDSKALFSGDTVLGYGRPYKVPLVRMDMETMLHSLEKLSKLNIEWILPGHGDVVHGGNKRLNEFIKDLKDLPSKVLESLKEKPNTPAGISEELLIWPQTAETVLRELDKAGKIRKVENQVSTVSTAWVAT